jgi:hypothetical protein
MSRVPVNVCLHHWSDTLEATVEDFALLTAVPRTKYELHPQSEQIPKVSSIGVYSQIDNHHTLCHDAENPQIYQLAENV